MQALLRRLRDIGALADGLFDSVFSRTCRSFLVNRLLTMDLPCSVLFQGVHADRRGLAFHPCLSWHCVLV